MKLTPIFVFLLACLTINAQVATQYLQGLTSPVQANIDSRVLKAGDTMTGPLNIGGGSVVASTPVLNLTQTWNNGAVAFYGIKVNITDSASSSVSEFAEFQVGGVQKIGLYKSGSAVFQGNVTAFAGSLTLGNTVVLQESANILALRNLANAQTWNVYGTTDAGLLNYRRLRSTITTGGAATIAAEGLGTGVSGNTLALVVNAVTALSFSPSGTASFSGTVYAGGGSQLAWASRAAMQSPVDGVILLGNYLSTDADIFLKFGVNTSAAAGIKRVGTALQARLNDDSDWAGFQSRYHRVSSGSPEGVVTAPVGALFSRIDGGAGTTLYVKESGSGNTGWVAK